MDVIRTGPAGRRRSAFPEKPYRKTEASLPLQRARRELVIGLSPLGRPSARAVASVARAGGLGVLDLGAGDVRVREALELTGQWSPGPFGVRVPEGCRLTPADLPG